MNQLELRRILRAARAGDTSRAWRMFERIADAGVQSDYDLLTLKGRLLKDRAIAGSGADRVQLFAAARDAYLSAARLKRATYPLINAAAVERLAGNLDRAREHAQATLDLLDRGDHEPDTAYWLAATRAEAVLHTGSVDAARELLGRAVALAPDAWEDHASTLRQFRLLLACLDEEDRWLEQLAPPATVHYSGIIHLDPALDDPSGAIADQVDRLRCGFAYGALAAGADIVIAEMLVARGAELHLVLPAPPDIFRRQSVVPFGEAWGGRYDRLLERCASLEIVAPGSDVSLSAVEFATQVAMGAAICQARALETRAVGLRLSDEAAVERGRAEPNAACDAAWARLGLPILGIPVSRLAATIAHIPTAELTAVIADATNRLTLDRPGADDLIASTGSGGYRVSDPVVAVRAALRALTTAPTLRLGITAGPVANDEDRVRLVETARLIATASAPGQLLVSRSLGLALLLLAPDLRCESDQELSTPLGEMPVWQVSTAECGS